MVASPRPAALMRSAAPTFTNRVDLLLWALPQDGLSPIVLNMRQEHGEGCIVEKIRSAVDGGEVIALWDPDEEWPSFAIGRKGATYYARGADGATRGTFATVEGAIKFGLTTRQEGVHGRS